MMDIKDALVSGRWFNSAWLDQLSLDNVSIASELAIALVIILIVMTIVSVRIAMHRLWPQHKGRLLGIAGLNMMAAFALLGLLLDWQWQVPAITEVHIYTKGASPSTLQSENTQPHTAQIEYVLPHSAKDLADTEHPSMERVNSLSHILALYPHAQTWHIYGDGLSKAKWQAFYMLTKGTSAQAQHLPKITFTPSDKITGLVNMRWPSKTVVGEPLEVSGKLQISAQSASAVVYRVSIKDPAGEILAQSLHKNNEAFSLHFTSTLPGHFLYRIELSPNTEPDRLLTAQSIDFEVLESSPLKILIKQSSPSFETRQLRDLLAQQGHQLSVLTRISKNKDIRQDINLPKDKQSGTIEPDVNADFSEQALANYDLIMMDARAFDDLNAQQKSNLQAALREGLGLHLWLDSASIDPTQTAQVSWLNNLLLQNNPARPEAYIRYQETVLDTPLAVLPVDINQPKGKVLVSDQNAATLVSDQQIGKGKVALSLLPSTYILRTQGNIEAYSAYWQYLISHIARPSTTAYWLSSQPQFADTLMQACLISAVPPAQTSSPLLVASNEDTFRYCGIYQAQPNSWYTLTAKFDEQTDLKSSRYIYAANTWQAWQQQQSHDATHKASQLGLHSVSLAPNIMPQYASVLPKPAYWWLLLGALGLLWIERKAT